MPELATSQADWPTVAFGDVVRQVKDRVDPGESGLKRYIGGEHMDSDDLRIRRWGEIGDDYLGPAFHMRFKPGHVLYGSRRTYLRKVALADFEGITANTTYVLESKNPDVLVPELLPFIMQTESFHAHSKRESKGSVNPYVNFSDLAWYQFGLPPLADQRRILKVLDACERSFASMTELCIAAELAHQSACIRLGNSMRKTPDVEWTSIGELGDVRMGRQRSPKYQTGKHTTPYLRVANVFDGYIDTSDVLEMDFDERDFATYLLRDGDILLNEGQSRELVGRSAIYRGEVTDCCFQNTLIRFRSDSVLPDFAQTIFRYWLYTGRFAAASKQTTSIAHLGLKRFVQMKFPLPDKESQRELVAPVLSLESASLRARRRKDQISDMKRSLLDQALMVGRQRA